MGVDDTTIDLFESQYPVPNGVSYNSYVILDEKVAVMDTVDRRAAPDWLENLEAELKGRAPDYLVIQHLEPDHAGSIGLLAERYPNMTLVGNVKTFSMLPKFFPALAAAPALTTRSVSAGSDAIFDSIESRFAAVSPGIMSIGTMAKRRSVDGMG